MCIEKNDEHQKTFPEDLVLLIAKGYYPLSSVENMWLKRFALRHDPRVVFPSRKSLTEDVLPAMVEHTLETIVRPALSACCTVTATFDLWMSKGAQDTFALVVNFLSADWESMHVTVGLFEANDTTGAAFAVQLQLLLENFDLTKKVICYVKDEGTNLGTMTQALKIIVSCDMLGQTVPFEGACFGHAMSKA